MLPSPPTISLAMTAFNRERFIGEAIESVVRQTRGDFELIVWDDGSSDQTVEIARRFERDDPRVRVVAGEHRGHAPSLRDAWAQARGIYLGSVDSDDRLAPTTLAETAEVLDTCPEIGVVYSDYVVLTEAGKEAGIGKRCAIPYSRDGLLLNFMTFQFRLMRREAYERVGGVDASADCAEDYDLCLKLSEVTQFRQLKRPLYFYRQHRSSISANSRLRQIYASQSAIARALERRGLADKFQIDVELVGRYFLRKKNSAFCE